MHWMKVFLRSYLVPFIVLVLLYILPLFLTFCIDVIIKIGWGISLDNLFYDNWLINTLLLGIIGVFLVNIVLLLSSLIFKKQTKAVRVLKFTFVVACLSAFIVAVMIYSFYNGYLNGFIPNPLINPRVSLLIFWIIMVVLNGLCQVLR